jgi:hypothetical protein
MDIIEKLSKLEQIEKDDIWDGWSKEEQKKLLEIYLIISKKETYIFDLIWKNHGCDSWEDIFRDYNINYLADKISGVEIAIENIDNNFKR